MAGQEEWSPTALRGQKPAYNQQQFKEADFTVRFICLKRVNRIPLELGSRIVQAT